MEYNQEHLIDRKSSPSSIINSDKIGLNKENTIFTIRTDPDELYESINDLTFKEKLMSLTLIMTPSIILCYTSWTVTLNVRKETSVGFGNSIMIILLSSCVLMSILPVCQILLFVHNIQLPNLFTIRNLMKDAKIIFIVRMILGMGFLIVNVLVNVFFVCMIIVFMIENFSTMPEDIRARRVLSMINILILEAGFLYNYYCCLRGVDDPTETKYNEELINRIVESVRSLNRFRFCIIVVVIIISESFDIYAFNQIQSENYQYALTVCSLSILFILILSVMTLTNCISGLPSLQQRFWVRIISFCLALFLVTELVLSITGVSVGLAWSILSDLLEMTLLAILIYSDYQTFRGEYQPLNDI